MKKLIWEGKELTVKEASLLLWGDLAKTCLWKRDSKYLPLVEDIIGQCPYCEFYIGNCKKCLLFKGIKTCDEKNSLYRKWFYGKLVSHYYWAQKIYNRILKMPDLLPEENPPEGYKERENGTRIRRNEKVQSMS